MGDELEEEGGGAEWRRGHGQEGREAITHVSSMLPRPRCAKAACLVTPGHLKKFRVGASHFFSLSTILSGLCVRRALHCTPEPL